MMRVAVKQAIMDIVSALKDRLYDVQPPAGVVEPYGVIAPRGLFYYHAKGGFNDE
ncbi:hypothetical protein MUG84_22000 [Paenibacillus sp. KQZ6P-2]|uniref:Uncharacterized protein n=1 Tax=Paenibacillus mangrovi TaxID=2931978 RepID=A0A9X1WV91_9BACL|nr:hypothetical protein [Paenibacillus mangrovi]MCJ8014375.1 hypothetical protein [Paenibacillus mangrovi]